MFSSTPTRGSRVRRFWKWRNRSSPVDWREFFCEVSIIIALVIGCHGSHTARCDACGQWLTTWQRQFARGVLARRGTPPQRRVVKSALLEKKVRTSRRRSSDRNVNVDCCKGVTDIRNTFPGCRHSRGSYTFLYQHRRPRNRRLTVSNQLACSWKCCPRKPVVFLKLE